MIVSGFVLIDYYLLLQSMHDHEIYILPFDVIQYFSGDSIKSNTMFVLLRLCRMYYYITEMWNRMCVHYCHTCTTEMWNGMHVYITVYTTEMLGGRKRGVVEMLHELLWKI